MRTNRSSVCQKSRWDWAVRCLFLTSLGMVREMTFQLPTLAWGLSVDQWKWKPHTWENRYTGLLNASGNAWNCHWGPITNTAATRFQSSGLRAVTLSTTRYLAGAPSSMALLRGLSTRMPSLALEDTFTACRSSYWPSSKNSLTFCKENRLPVGGTTMIGNPVYVFPPLPTALFVPPLALDPPLVPPQIELIERGIPIPDPEPVLEREEAAEAEEEEEERLMTSMVARANSPTTSKFLLHSRTDLRECSCLWVLSSSEVPGEVGTGGREKSCSSTSGTDGSLI